MPWATTGRGTVPTYERLARFLRDWADLDPSQRAAFLSAVTLFVAGLRGGAGFHRSLRVKKMQGREDIWEMTWAPDGRATFQYGPSIKDGEPHVIWRRIGTHDIFKRP